jgi:hypothetical protein
MYFTLAVSAATREACAALTAAAEGTDPRVMPIPGRARVVWRAPGERAALLRWGQGHRASASHAGTIWAEGTTVRARTSLTRVDPVYLAEVAGAVVVSDRACWAAAVTRRLHEPDPVMIGAFLSLGYPVGGATPFRGVRALGGDRELRAADGRLAVTRARPEEAPGGAARASAKTAARVAAALADAVRPLGEAAAPVELSLTGGKDSRLIAAALTAARVPVRARTHGFGSHPDVIVAGLIASRLGLEHTVTEPRAPGAPDEADVLGRIRAAVLVSDGTLSAFENVGWPDPQFTGTPVVAGGHGGELLRGGYAQAAWRTPAALGAAAAAELFRRMTTRRLSLLRPGPARAYLASLVPSAAALARGPLAGLDDFYLMNRAGRWSAAARQAYLLRSPLAGTPWHGEPRTPATVLTVPPGPAAGDWRRDYGDAVAGFLRGYVLDHGAASPLFGIVRRRAAERSLRSPQSDPHAVWALATLAALLSGDWLNAREPARQALVSLPPLSRGRT